MPTYELPLYTDSHTYAARLDRLLVERMFNGKQRVFTGWSCSQHAGTPNFTVDVTLGSGIILCTTETNGGAYLAETTATVTLTCPATPGSNRTDKLIAWVRDPDAGGVGSDADPDLADLILQVISGATTTPGNAMLLANILRTPSESAIFNAAISGATGGGADIAPRGGWPHSVLSAAPTGVGVAGDIYVVV